MTPTLQLAQDARRQRGETLLAQRIDGIVDALVDYVELDLSNADRVGPDARHKLKGILQHYAKEKKPFTACVRDNAKRFGPKANGVCAVVKDIIFGTTKWRGKGNPAGMGPHPYTGLSLGQEIQVGDACVLIDLDQDVFDLLDRIAQTDYKTIIGLEEVA